MVAEKERNKSISKSEASSSATTSSPSTLRAIRGLASNVQLFAPKMDAIRVGIYADFFPVAYEDRETRKFAGLDVDILEGFSRAAGLSSPPKFVRIRDFSATWNVSGEWKSRIDVAVGGIGRSTWRSAQNVEWTMPYFHVMRTVIYNLADPIRRFPEDVTGKIAATMGTTGVNDAFERMYAVNKHHLLDYRNGSETRDLSDLLKGKVQGVMRGSFVGKAWVARHPDQLGMVKPWIIDPKVGGDNFSFPCRRGSGLSGIMNLYLQHIIRNGEMRRLLVKHDML